MGKVISFKYFLQKGVDRKAFGDTPENDFAVDALADKTFRDFTAWEDLQNYLQFRGAIPEALEAARKVFKRWKASQ